VAAGTANHRQGTEACTKYGRFEIVLESDKSVPKLSALHQLVMRLAFHLNRLHT